MRRLRILHYFVLAVAAVLLFPGCALKLSGALEEDAAADPLGDDARLDVIVEPEGDGRCPGGLTYCGGICVDTASDRLNCGSCGNECDPRADCVDGHCRCLDGLTDCGGTCVDTDTNNNHCGECDHACIPPQLCNGAGVCATQCTEPFTLCNPGPDAYCADLTSDPDNCGECGAGCASALHAIATCTGGVCGLRCESGFVDLDGDGGCECAVTGSEICDGMDNDCNGGIDDGFPCPLGSSPESCNDPVTSCAGLKTCLDDCTWSDCQNEAWQCIPGATESCPEGCGASRTCTESCAWGPCEGGCSGDMPDCCGGTCTSILTDPLNCGACGNPCGTGSMCCDGSCAACCSGSDCIDADPCTADTCDGGTCSHTSVGNMGACAGGDGTAGICCDGVCYPGGNCCESANCGSTTPSCLGTPPLCSSASSSSACSLIMGCSWDGRRHVCQGTPLTCGGMESTCSAYCGCNWASGTGTCSGNGGCSSIGYLDTSHCSFCGCGWGLFTGCGGHADCSSLSCSSQSGCSMSTGSGTCSDHHCQ
jgi:hypothetical protein